MVPYLAVWSIPALFAAISHIRELAHWSRSRVAFAAFAIFLIFFIGLRHYVGADWVPYGLRIRVIGDSSFVEAVLARDPGYEVLSWLSYHLGAGVYGVNFVCAIIFVTGLGVFCRKQPRPWLALAIAIPYLVVITGMSLTRQATALGLVLLAFALVGSGRVWPAIATVAVAALFHRSAPIVLPFLVFARWTNPVIRGALIVLALSAAGAMFALEFERFSRLYLQREMDSSGAGARAALNFAAAVTFLLFRSRMRLNTSEGRLWFWLSIACLLTPAALLVLPSTTVVDRASIYFVALQVAVFSRLPLCFSPQAPVALSVLSAFGGVLIVWFALSGYTPWWLPYQNVLTGTDQTPLWVELDLRDNPLDG